MRNMTVGFLVALVPPCSSSGFHPYDDSDDDQSSDPLELDMIASLMHSSLPLVSNVHYSSRLVAIITPTYIRPFQFAHVTMLANTLRAAKALGLRFVWIVVEEVSEEREREGCLCVF